MATTLTAQEFVNKWRGNELKERSASQEHFLDLCHLIGHPTPVESDPTGATFCFEAGATKMRGGQGWPHDITDEQILQRLLALNLERARREKTDVD